MPDENKRYAMSLHEVVKKLVGPISPVGETNEDNRRFENLKVTADLVDSLLSEMDDIVYRTSSNQEHSIKRAVGFIEKFFDSIGIEK